VNGYVLDDLALDVGLTVAGDEHQRREFSRLVIDAIAGGPRLDVPALCLAAADALRRGIAEYVAEMVVDAPVGAIGVSALSRSRWLAYLRLKHPSLGWSAAHAVSQALENGSYVLTATPGRYRDVAITVLAL
jgi:hypothetical protein